MTELAYLATPEAAYVREFRARIVARPPGAVVLDRTYFYPVGGGQASDRGTVRRSEGGPPIEVGEVAKQGSSVVHRLRAVPSDLASWRLGEEIVGSIDWERRHRHMRLHTGQHYASAVVYAEFGIRTRRARMEGDAAALDLERPLPPDALDRLAPRWAELVTAPRDVRLRTVPRAEWDQAPAARTGLVPLAASVDPVRLIEIDGVDLCPCGGTHVRSTREVGEPRVSLSRGRDRLTLELTDPPAPTPSE